MTNEEKQIINEFFRLTQNLRDQGIIRSSKYLGDIAEFICQSLYDLTLIENQREEDIDANDINGLSYQIKINNSAQGTNQDIGDNSRYNFLILIITRNSFLFNSNNPNAHFLIYLIPSQDINGRYIAKKVIDSISPDKILNVNLDQIFP